MIATYRDWNVGTRFPVWQDNATAVSGFLIKPRAGQIIVIEEIIISGRAAANADLTTLANVQLCTVGLDGLRFPSTPAGGFDLGIVPLSPMYRSLPASAAVHRTFNIHEKFEIGEEVEVGQDAGVGWFAQVGTNGVHNFVAFANLSIGLVARFEAAGTRSVHNNRQFQPSGGT